MDKFFAIMIGLVWLLSLGLVFYIAVQMQKGRAENEIKVIDLKDKGIESETNSEPLSDLVNLNDKSESSGG